MKKLLFCLVIAAGFFSCSEDQGIGDAGGNDSPETKSVLRERPKYYTLAYKIPSNALLTPGPIATQGDLLVIGNVSRGLEGIELYGLENGSFHQSIRSWGYKDTTVAIEHAPTAVCIHDNRIYVGVADEGKVYVFDASSYGFVTTIGNGNIQVDKPSDDKLAVGAPCSIVGDGDKLLIRDRLHMRVYNTADITPANYEAVPYYAVSKEKYPVQPATTLNQAYVGYAHYVYLTDADSKQVLCVKPLASLPAGDEVSMIDETSLFSMAPSGATLSEDRAYLSFGAEGVIKEYSTSGFAFKQDVVVKNNALSEVNSLAANRIENQPVLLISTPKAVWVVWVTPFERMAQAAE